MAKVILINDSPREDGCTARALEEMMRIFSEEGIESELINIGKRTSGDVLPVTDVRSSDAVCIMMILSMRWLPSLRMQTVL